jgi:protein-disulfide isomerase
MKKRDLWTVLAVVAIAAIGAVIWEFRTNPFQPLAPQDLQAAELAVTPVSATTDTPVTTNALPATPEGWADRTLGKEDAPVLMVEYASLTCPHCAHFHRDTFDQIKREYVDKGLVRFVFRPFPFDAVAMGGSVLAYCLPENQFYGFLSAVFASQDTWAKTSDPLAELRKMARLAGLSEAQMQKCEAKDSPLPTGILRQRVQAEKDLGISSTPSFYINGEIVQGARKFEVYQNAIEAALKKAKAQ